MVGYPFVRFGCAVVEQIALLHVGTYSSSQTVTNARDKIKHTDQGTDHHAYKPLLAPERVYMEVPEGRGRGG